MRALIRDKSDHTLIVIEVYEACYNPEENELYLYSPDNDYCVEGQADLSIYKASPIK